MESREAGYPAPMNGERDEDEDEEGSLRVETGQSLFLIAMVVIVLAIGLLVGFSL